MIFGFGNRVLQYPLKVESWNPDEGDVKGVKKEQTHRHRYVYRTAGIM